MPLPHEQFCRAIADETSRLCALLEHCDLSGAVPTCPDWTLEDLAVHVGQAHRWAARTVSTRAHTEGEDEDVPHFAPKRASDRAELVSWLTEGAGLFVAELRASGPDAPVWSWSTDQRSGFWARRMTHETVVHRADAFLAAGKPFTVEPELAADTIDEWLELVSAPRLQEEDEELRELRRHAGRALRLEATDAPEGLTGDWLITLGEEGVSWRRVRGQADVALRGPLNEVLLAFYRRVPPHHDGLHVTGDSALLDFWLERVSFS